MYKKMSRIIKFMTKLFHRCDDCKPMIGMCHGCLKSNITIEDKRLILCHGCCQAS
jgi:hypothetical protein